MKHLLSAVIAALAFYTTEAQISSVPRMVAYVHTNYDGADYLPKDSGRLFYAHGWGFDAKSSSFQFDSNNIYVYQVPYSSYAQTIREYETYDANKNILVDLTKRIRYSDSAWVDTLQYLYLYDAGQNLLSKTQQKYTISFWTNVDRHVYTYDGSNNILSHLYQIWSVNGWQNNYNHDYTYDSYNNLITDVYKTYDTVVLLWKNVGQTIHTYNSANQEISNRIKTWVSSTSSWADSIQNAFTYDAVTKKITNKVHQNFILFVYKYDTSTNYIYDSHNNLISQEEQLWKLFPTWWANSVLYTYTYDTANNRISALKQIWDTSYASSGYIKVDSSHYTYNNYHQLTSVVNTTWNISGYWEPVLTDHYHRYYYEFEPAGVVNTKQNSGLDLKIYPSPANDMLSIDINTNEAESSVIAFYDIRGKLWNQWQTGKCTNYHNSLSVSQLPAGTYIVNIKNSQEQTSKIISIVH